MHVHVEVAAKSLTSRAADSLKMKDSMLEAASTPSDLDQEENVDADHAERRRAWIAAMRTMGPGGCVRSYEVT